MADEKYDRRKSIDPDRPFGIGPFRPKCLQHIATIQGFVFFIALYNVFVGMFGPYSISQITTIEKHFGMTSQMSGFLFTIQDIGFFILSPFMGIFFCRLHRPRVLAACCTLQALSNLCFVLPFFTHIGEINRGETVVDMYGNDTNSDNVCRWSDSANKTCDEAAQGVSDSLAYGLMAFGMFINGAGATGMWTVGIAYIDDNADQLESPKYLGCLFCLRLMAPIMGSLLGSGVGGLHVHLGEGIASGHWVGAWWLGYFVIGTVTCLCILPLAMFPRRIPGVKERLNRKAMELKANENGEDQTDGEVMIETYHEMEKFDAKDLYRALIRVFTNVPFVIFCLGLTVDIAGGVAYASFLPKYLEDQFYVTTSVSNLIMGVCVPVADAAGMAFSGWFVSNSRLRLSRLFLIAIAFEVCIYISMFTLMIPTCPTVEMKGISEGAIVESCNAMCQCDMKRYSPVCGADGLTYYSPCFAGCTEFTEFNKTYHNCGCLPSNATAITAVKGLCTDQCDSSIIIYAAILFLVNMFGSTMFMAFMMFILRVVEKRDKSLGQSTINIFAAIGSMPAATLFGRMIDGMCVLFYPSSSGCDSSSGACVRYDRDQFRYKFHGAALGLRILGVLSYFLVWYGIRNRKFAGDDERSKQKKNPCSCDMKAMMDDD